MKKILRLNGLVISFVALTFIFITSSNVFGQTTCSRQGAATNFDIVNATNKNIEIKWVGYDCNEGSGDVKKPKESVNYKTFIGNAFRVYESGTNRLITEFVADGKTPKYKIENCSQSGGASASFTVRNATYRGVEMRQVLQNCSEGSNESIAAQTSQTKSAAVGSVYRVYEKGTNRFLEEIVVSSSSTSYKIENCSKNNGNSTPLYVWNGSAKDVEVRWIDGTCKEHSGSYAITPGKQFHGNTFVGNVFRVYEKGTTNFIKEIIVRPSKTVYLVEAFSNPTPSKSFLETVNQIRKGAGLTTELKYHAKLNQACQWWAGFMADQDQSKSGHKVTEFTSLATQKEKDKIFLSAKIGKMNTPLDRMVFFGWKRSNSGNAEATGFQFIQDYNLLGSRMALSWTTTTTHYRPFYDQDPTKYTHIGFGFAISTKHTNPDAYYGCAIFANP